MALVSGGVALLAANISALIPDNVFAGLHATRLGGATVNEMHSELSNLEDEQARIRASSSELSTRVDASERDATMVRQRIAALEVSVPKLTEALNTRGPAGIDPSLVTGSIDAPAQSFSKPGASPGDTATVKAARAPVLPATGQTAPAETAAVQPMPAPLAATPRAATSSARTDAGGWAAPAVTVLANLSSPRPSSTRPDVIAEGAIPPAAPAPRPAASRPAEVASTPAAAAPAPARADVKAIGVAIGAPVSPAGAFSAWQVLAAKVGVLLVGTSPLLAEDPAGSHGKVLVAGPLPDVAAAAKLCANIEQAGLACTPMPYVGGPVVPTGKSP